MRHRFLDLHILQAIPAANLNRNDAQEPKTIEVGNTIRSMVSSQAWKRPIRLDIEEELREPAARTRNLPLVLAEHLRTQGWPADLAAFAGAQAARSATKDGLKTDPANDGRTQALAYVPADITNALADLCAEHRTALEEGHAEYTAAAKKPALHPLLPTKKVAEILARRTDSIALLGRMHAELPGAHVEAALQMAPAYTVHKADLQPDYFTAVEDWPQPGERGSAHLQTAFLTTGLFYRFATVSLTELLNNLNGDTSRARRLLTAFTDAFIMTLPQAKKTATAHHSLPDLIHYTVRERRPVSYSAAFEQPVTAHPRGGYTQPARDALASYATAVDRLIGTKRRLAHGHTGAFDTPITPLGTHHTTFEDLTAAATTAAFPHTQDTA
ncbi:type I-E CRISPR-associated protein Cas7/Cse4/CasC [Kitasatospora sp. NPDC089509]|uniref:type I-E CRISPR-associated protein Cas7/Cse4/CasC n=1 Tax=Kitasatospora sp. NPDC089509 TaxID=3364079 RepID=UPI0038271710